MSHVETEYEFLQHQCVMIFGKNMTDEGSDSNGSGKSVILEAITLAITGEVSRDIGRDEFINEDADSTNVNLHLTNSFGEIKDLIIDRTIHRTKAEKIVLTENGIVNKEITGVSEASARIYELIGLTKFDLQNFFLIGQDKRFSFLTCGDSDKKDIISRFSNTGFINDKIELLKIESKNKKIEIDRLNSEYGKVESKIELLDAQIKDFNKNFSKVNKEKIDNLKSKRIELKSKYKAKEEASTRLLREVEKAKDFLDNNQNFENDLSIAEKKKIKISKSISKTKDDLIESNSLITHLKSLIDGEIICPNCNHGFIIDSDINPKQLPSMLEEAEEHKNRFEKEIDSLKKDSKKIESKIEKLSSLKFEIREVKSIVDSFEKNSKSISSQIKELKERIDDIDEQIESIKSEKKNDKELNKKKKQRSEFRAELEKIEAEKLPIQKEYENNEFWIHHFGKKGFMTFLTNKSIKSIEGITNSYLKKINTNLQVEIDGFTTLKGGGLSDKINVSIVRNGKRVAKFNRYSGGEKGRIVIANILGLQKLINMSCPNGGLNFLGLDEVFEGLDVTGQVEVTKILEDIEMTTLVVSHRSKPIGVKNELIIKKENGISFIDKNKTNQNG